MMATRRPKDVVAVTPNGDITEGMILGYIALVSIPNKPVSTAKLRRSWLVHGQDEKMVPKDRRGADVFMAACRSVESRRTHNDRTHEIKVDRVVESSEECVYQITQMVRDKDQKLIEHPKAMRLTYTARDGKIKDESIDDRQLYKELKGLADTIRDDFAKNSSKVPGAKVRAAMRETLMSEHATRIQNKGVFFLPKAAKRTLEDLQSVLRDVYGDGNYDAELALIPLAADSPEKAMVKRHFAESVTGEIDELLAEVSGRLKADAPIRADRRANMVGERKRISDGVERYKDLLGDRLLELDEKIKLLDDGLEELLLGTAVTD